MPILSPTARLIASADGKRYEILAIAVGPWHPSKKGPTGKPIYSTEESLRASVSVFEGVPVAAYELKPGFHDHLPDGVLAATEENGIVFLKNRVGRLTGARYGKVATGESGIIVGLDVTDAQIDEAIRASLSGNADFDGFSIDGSADWDIISVDGVQYDHPKRLTSLKTLDMVRYPAAGGKVLRLAASQSLEGTEMNLTAKQVATLGALLRAAGVTKEAQAKIWADKADVFAECKTALQTALKDKADALKIFGEAIAKIEKGEEVGAQFDALDALSGELSKPAPVEPAKTPEPEKPEPVKAKETLVAPPDVSKDPAVVQANEILDKAQKLADTATATIGEATIEREVTASHLPDVTKKQIAERLKASRTYESAKIKAELDKEATYLKAILGEHFVPIMRVTGSIEMPQCETDLLILGMRGLLAGRDIAGPDKKKVPAFRSFREMNQRITGSRYDEPLDRVFRKLSRLASGIGYEASELVDLDTGRLTASFASTDLASVYLVAMHNQFIADYKEPSQYDDWRRIARIVSFKDLYAHAFTRQGWYAAAPSISEGGTYQETATVPTDENISMAAVKYGQIMSITDRMVINDNLGAMQRLQRAFSDGMKRDIYLDVMDVIRTNVAVAYGADTTALVIAGHSNGVATGGVDLTDSAVLEAGWGAMVAQTEFGSAMVLGDLNKPRFLLTHTLRNAQALRLTQGERAIQLATASGYMAATDYLPDAGMTNPMASKGIEPIIMLNATTATNWWLLADPNTTPAPAVMVGFLNGQEQPEVVTEPANTGSNFTADKIRIKVKNWRDVEPGDHRGIYGQIT